MPITDWSDDILIVERNDDPAFSEDIEMLLGRIEQPEGLTQDSIGNMKSVNFVN